MSNFTEYHSARIEGLGADKHLYIGQRGGMWMLKGHFAENAFAPGYQGDDTSAFWVGPRGGLWQRIGWWTDVVQVPLIARFSVFVCLLVCLLGKLGNIVMSMFATFV